MYNKEIKKVKNNIKTGLKIDRAEVKGNKADTVEIRYNDGSKEQYFFNDMLVAFRFQSEMVKIAKRGK